MHTKSSLIKQLKDMGLKTTDYVMIHSSMKAIGEVEGKADTVLDALMEYFKDGKLMLPTHSWATMDEERTLFDLQNEPSCVGILGNIFRKRGNVYRSYHPTHSMAVYGKNAIEYIKGEEDILTPCNPIGAWGRLKDVKAKIMLVGCNHGQNTFIHGIEEIVDIPDRIAVDPILFTIKDNDKEIQRYFHKHHTSYISSLSLNYNKLEELLEKKGIVTYHKFGDALVFLMDADVLSNYIEKLLIEDPTLLNTRDELKDLNKYL